MKSLILTFLFLCFSLQAIEHDVLQTLLGEKGIVVHGATCDQEAIICCHGYKGTWELAKRLPQVFPYHVIGFDFPDAGRDVILRDPHTLKYGTLEELTPLVEIMRACVIEGGLDTLHLYGFSAGGAAVVNVLATLNNGRYPLPEGEREKILAAIQRGKVILDCPLKSLSEIAEMVGPLPPLLVVRDRYIKNNLVPIESLKELYPLSLNILLHFQDPDFVVANRDDDLFAERLKQYNRNGRTVYIKGTEGKHWACLPTLQKAYEDLF